MKHQNSSGVSTLEVEVDPSPEFWSYLDVLASSHSIKIDRPSGSAHPRYPDKDYPLDYGYLEGTHARDGQGIDVWLGSSGDIKINGILCTVDLHKIDVEIKLLIGCTDVDLIHIRAFLNQGDMRVMQILRTGDDQNA